MKLSKEHCTNNEITEKGIKRLVREEKGLIKIIFVATKKDLYWIFYGPRRYDINSINTQNQKINIVVNWSFPVTKRAEHDCIFKCGQKQNQNVI